MRITIIATGFENTEAPAAQAEVAAPVAPVEESAPVVAAAPTASAPEVHTATAAPAAPAAPTTEAHPPKYDTEGEDSAISEDDFDDIMSIFRNRGRR